MPDVIDPHRPADTAPVSSSVRSEPPASEVGVGTGAVLLRIELDRDRCEGHGVCEDIAPEVYRLDDDGVPEILLDPVPEALAAKAESGARLCPVAALRTFRQQAPSA